MYVFFCLLLLLCFFFCTLRFAADLAEPRSLAFALPLSFRAATVCSISACCALGGGVGGGVVHCNCKRQAFSTELRAPFAPRATRIQRAKRKQQQRQWQRSQANKRTSQSGFLTRLSLALSLTLCSNVGQTPFLRGGGRRAAGAL